jgi:membrane associated rhomboid family serine protease
MKRASTGFLMGNFLNFFKKSATNWIILGNVIFYFILFFLIKSFGNEQILSYAALQSNGFFSGKFWTLLTSMFLHIELWHLLANMFSLYFIGNFVERLIGKKRVIWFYLISGIFAGIFYVFLSHFFGTSLIGGRLFGNPETYAVGASGAIFALLGLLVVLIPKYPVYLISGPIIALVLDSILPIFVSSQGFLSVFSVFVSIYILLCVFSLVSFPDSFLRKISIPIKMKLWAAPIIAIVPLVLIGLFVNLPIGNSAHIGGLILGLAYAFYLRKKYKRKTALIVDYFSE